MPPEQRRVRLSELVAAVQRRTRALDGSDDEDDAGVPDAGGGEDDGQE